MSGLFDDILDVTHGITSGLVTALGGKGYHLDGVKNGNYLAVERHPALYDQNQFSLGMSFKTDAAAKGGVLFKMHTALQVSVTDAGQAVFTLLANAKGESGTITTKGLHLADKAWHSFTLSYDATAGAMIAYVDGAQVGKLAVTAPTKLAQTWDPMIGDAWGAGMKGTIDDVRISTEATTAADAKAQALALTNAVKNIQTDIVAVHDTATATEDTALTLKAATLLANDVNPGGLAMYVDAVRVIDGTGTAKMVSGNVVYTPGANDTGPATLEYLASDHHGHQGIGTIAVAVKAANDAPVVEAEKFSTIDTAKKSSVVGQLSGHDADGDSVTYTMTTTGTPFGVDTHGRIIVADAAKLDAGNAKLYHLTVAVNDGHGGTASAAVDVQVKAATSLLAAAKIAHPNAVIANDATQLGTLLQNAKGGETILLRPDVDYDVLVRQMAAKSMVTVTSLDPDHPANIVGLDLRSANYVTFDHLKFEFSGTAVQYQTDVVVSKSNHVTFSNNVFKGTATAFASSSHAENGMAFADSTDIRILNNEVSNYFHGIGGMRLKGVTISDNDFHSMQGDGMHFAQVQGVTIADNHFHDFLGSDQKTVTHNDYIQFQTTGTTAATTDVMIRDNVFTSGDFQSQVIFFRDQLGDLGKGEMRFQDVTIQGNVIYNSNHHSITGASTDGLVIRDNTVIAHPDGSEVSGINVNKSTGVTMSNNVAPSYQIGAETKFVVNSGNLTLQDSYANQAHYGDHVFVNVGEGAGATIKDLFVDPSGDLAKANGTVYGSQLLKVLATPEHLTAVAVSDHGGLAYAFDGKLSADAHGAVAAAKFTWDFGDGTKASGIGVNHTYAGAGDYEVILTVQTATETDTARFHASAAPPVEGTLNFDDNNLQFDYHGGHLWQF